MKDKKKSFTVLENVAPIGNSAPFTDMCLATVCKLQVKDQKKKKNLRLRMMVPKFQQKHSTFRPWHLLEIKSEQNKAKKTI
jgi:hypothetical protein